MGSWRRQIIEFPGNLWQLKFRETASYNPTINIADIVVTKMANGIINLSGIAGNKFGLGCLLNELLAKDYRSYSFDESKTRFKDSEDSLISTVDFLRNINHKQINPDIRFDIDLNPRSKTVLIKTAYMFN